MTTEQNPRLTIDALCYADLDRVYISSMEGVLRDHAFRILLKCNDTVKKLEKLTYNREQWRDDWTTRELIEITNHFRLHSSPENEIRIYRECRDEAFRTSPRVREFYILALNKAGRPAEAINEGARIIAAGGNNALVWSTIGESYTARMIFAESLAAELIRTGEDPATVDNHFISKFSNYFPDQKLADMNISRAQSLRLANLRMAIRIFQRGFRESGSSFPGLGWMMRTIDQQTDLAVEHARLVMNHKSGSDEEVRKRVLEEKLAIIERDLGKQSALVSIALDLQGGGESLDYWNHSGRLLLAVMQGKSPEMTRLLLPNLFSTADADFKLEITIRELQRLKKNFEIMRDIETGWRFDAGSLNTKIECTWLALSECNKFRKRFKAAGKDRKNSLKNKYRESVSVDQRDGRNIFLAKTFNFLALTSNLTPLSIQGGLGRVGSRVPDLLINRRVQEDLADIVYSKILQALPLEERGEPRAVIARIQKVIGDGLKIGDLQDLQSPSHSVFDIRSDGLIALSGIDIDMRKNTRTGTDLTAALLMQNGDCRETMYLNGALYACWQQMQVKKCIAKAMLCLDLDFQEGFETIVNEEIPALMRYQLRGGHFSLYVDSISMVSKYKCERMAGNNHAVLRSCSTGDLLSTNILKRYEMENSKIQVNYKDGSTFLFKAGELSRKIKSINYEKIESVRLLNLVEEHSMTFLYDSEQKTVEFCDGFYNEKLFESPYVFGSGPVDVQDLSDNSGFFRANSRQLIHPDGSLHSHPVYLEFLPFSQTDYEPELDESDLPGIINLMGRTFSGDLQRERERLEEGTSLVPRLLEKVQAWQIDLLKSAVPNRRAAERNLSRILLDLARDLRGKMKLQRVNAETPLIIEETENPNLYLVLSGKLNVYRRGRQLYDEDNIPVVSEAGSILGDISALRKGKASATATGDAVVLGIPMTIIRELLTLNRNLRKCMEDLAHYRTA